MVYRKIKQILIGVLSGALIFVSAAYSQTDHASTDTCPVRLRVFSFAERTTEATPVDAASVTFTDPKTKMSIESVSMNGEVLLEGMAQKTFKISVIKDGFRKSTDTFQVDCLKMYQGAVNHFIVMWEGDPSKTVDYSRIDVAAGKSGGEKAGPAKVKNGEKQPPGEPFKIGAAPQPPTPAPAVVAEDRGEVAGPSRANAFRIGDAEPIDLKQGSYTKDAGSNSVSKGVVNGAAVMLVKPKYPPTAMAVGASGAVSVQVIIDEDGYVVAATAVSGHPLLQSGSVMAARASRFKPTLLEGVPVKVTGIVIYNYQ